MTLDDAMALVRQMKAEGVHAFELDGLKVQFVPRVVPQAVKAVPGAEATQPATKSTKPPPEPFQGMDVPTLLGVSPNAEVP